jgi:hypothetical protein
VEGSFKEGNRARLPSLEIGLELSQSQAKKNLKEI